MKIKLSFLTIFFPFFLLAGCNDDSDGSDVFVESRNFVFTASIDATSLTQEDSFYILSPVTEFAPDPEAYTIEDNEDLTVFNQTHTNNPDEYISLADLDTWTYFFIRDPGCPDYFEYEENSYGDSSLTITLYRFHQPDVACAATYMELYLVFKARKDPDIIKVFKYDGSVQCSNDEIPLEDMEQELEDAGVTVYCSQKGGDGVAYPAVCGEATGLINIYEIDILDLSAAIGLGFGSVDDLPFYEDQACE